MSRIWKDRLARVRGAVDAQLGDELRITPMAAVSQYRAAGPDPGRPAFTVVAPLMVGEGDAKDLSGSARAGWSSQVPVGEAEARIDLDRYPAAAGLKARDLIVAVDRDDARYEVSRVDRGQRNRLVVRLTAL